VSSDSVSETAGYGLFVSDGGQPRAKIELDAANKELVFQTTYGSAAEGRVDYVFRHVNDDLFRIYYSGGARLYGNLGVRSAPSSDYAIYCHDNALTAGMLLRTDNADAGILLNLVNRSRNDSGDMVRWSTADDWYAFRFQYNGNLSIGGSFYYDGGLYQGSTRGIPAADIQSSAVTESKIGSGAVTESKIGSGAVTRTKVATGTSSASGSIAANGVASISMADYSFFPNVYSESFVLSVNAQINTSTGTTGRFLLRNDGTISHSYVVRWRYIAA
jgi:hypothetical protein